ncbi:hypothetical protein [Bacillus sp. 3255]|uniref:hypothetical protein n=1 Tax=Bacillus sp. 3255 TaxID=2817904 RepID=UPI00286658DD|nr:hypothetical protein [Bacillus sp. 3255]MDR6879797.1 hypothetical protein [Bacillus sp. 3255]
MSQRDSGYTLSSVNSPLPLRTRTESLAAALEAAVQETTSASGRDPRAGLGSHTDDSLTDTGAAIRAIYAELLR